jgi:predicted nucleic acid-binding protein
MGNPLPAAKQAGAGVVIDTNVALDLLVFDDPATTALRLALDQGQMRWLATPAMREELQRVLGYPKLAARIAFHGRDGDGVLAAMDGLCQWTDAAPKAPFTCADADDQKFIDLAAHHRVPLLSKDQHITSMRKRLATVGVVVTPHWATPVDGVPAPLEALRVN